MGPAVRDIARTACSWTSNGIVWTTGNGNGTIGRLDPATGKMVEYKTPSGGGGPHTLIITDDQSTIWFTMQSGNKVASLDTKTGAIKEYASSGGPYGLALDKAGNVWFCRMGDNKMGKLDPKTGQMSEVDTGRGSRPRRVATAPDGMLWVTLYGNGKLAKLDPAAMKVVKEYQLPAGDAGALRRHGGRRRHGVGERDQHRHRGALRSEDRADARRAAAVEERRHPQDGDRRERPAVVHGQPQRQAGGCGVRDTLPYLSAEKLEGLGITTAEVVACIEHLLRERKRSRAWSAPKPSIKTPDGRYLMATLSAADDPSFMAVKALHLNPRNPERGLAAINSVVILHRLATPACRSPCWRATGSPRCAPRA